ncbi:MAG: hypothetical protein HS104_35000 [Polyangiaceae bacterium]|nr:hypothetical protein [Polyangiaceae bacterium]MCL4752416.1 hypothetical protein [Myxococcales bacterium]
MRPDGFTSCLLLVAGLALSAPAGAEPEPPTTEETRNAARELARDAVAAHDAGDYARALDLIDRAHRLVSAPTISIWQARILAKLGRLIEANERYESTRRAPLPPDAPDVFRAAVADAAQEVEVLRKRIPRIRVRVSGPGADSESLVVTLDGKRVPQELIGVLRTVDPGQHELDARVAGVSRILKRVTVAEGSAADIELSLVPLDAGASSSADGEPPPAAQRSGSSRRTLAFVAAGIGVAGMATGVGFGLSAQQKRSRLDEACDDEKCPPSQQDALDSFRTHRTAAWVGYGVGAAGLASAAVLLFVVRDDARPRTGVLPWLGPGGAGVAGRF